jgi:hypothetical protein
MPCDRPPSPTLPETMAHLIVGVALGLERDRLCRRPELGDPITRGIWRSYYGF